MRNRLVTVAVVVLLALAGWPASSEAGSGKHKWWESEEFVRELGLTSDQQQRIDAVFRASLPSLLAAKADLDRLEGELSALVAEGTADEARVLQLIDRVEASRSAMGRTRSLMLFRMYRVLSPGQRVKLKALHERDEREKKKSDGGSR